MEIDEAISLAIRVGSGHVQVSEYTDLSITLEDIGINRLGTEFWRSLIKTLSPNEMIALFKGLVILERDLNLLGGSVAANIWVFRGLKNILPAENQKEIEQWAFENRGANPYTPLGTAIYEKSLEKHYEKKELKRKLGKAKDDQTRQESLQRKADRIIDAATHLQRADDRRVSRLQLINYLRGLNPIEKLEWLVSSDEPLQSIPNDIFETAIIAEYYSGYPGIEELEKRLDGHKGNWKSLLKSLKEKESEIP